MKNKLVLHMVFAMLLAFTVSSFVYLSFGNIYSNTILNYEAFNTQFQSGIYQYRILSGKLLIWTYEFLGSLGLNYDVFKLKFFNPDSEPQMYLAFYLLNTLFTVLSAAVLVLIFETKRIKATSSEKLMMTCLAIFAMVITQFALSPYDCSSYFFLLIFIYVFLQYLEKGKLWQLISLAFIILISTLNRESSALSLSFAATLLLHEFGLKGKSSITLLLFGGVFLGTYLGLRFSAENFTTNDGNLLTENFTQPKNYLGMLFWVIFFLLTILLANNRINRRQIIIFHLWALPYILMCFYTGILYEVRLYIPIFLGALVLSKYETKTLT